MTYAMLTALTPLLLVIAPGPIKSAKSPPPGTQPTATLPQVNPTAKSPKKKPGPKGSAKLPTSVKPLDDDSTTLGIPPIKPLVSPQTLAKLAKTNNIVPQGGPSATTTLATLSAGQARQGDFSLSFRCGFVHTYPSAGPEGLALFPNYLIELCRSRSSDDPGVEISFPAEAGRAYVVDCNSAANTRFRIKHKLGSGAWSPEASVSTSMPNDFVVADTAGEARVRFEFDPVDNHILTQAIRNCRVSRIG